MNVAQHLLGRLGGMNLFGWAGKLHASNLREEQKTVQAHIEAVELAQAQHGWKAGK